MKKSILVVGLSSLGALLLIQLVPYRVTPAERAELAQGLRISLDR